MGKILTPTGKLIIESTGDILAIADTQVTSTSPTEHLDSLSKYIIEHKPAHLVHIGDHWDFESLSSYASLEEREGRRLAYDLSAGSTALAQITASITAYNKQAQANKKKLYKPTMDFLMGNHEYRLLRMIAAHPEFIGLIDLETLITSKGWRVHRFLDPLWIGDICFNHFMANAMSGRAVGGSIENKLNKFPHSFIHGHQQQFQYGRRQNMQGKPHFGVCAGSFYLHDEAYRGACNTEIRGFTHLKPFINRFDFLDHDVEFVSLERLMAKYR